VAINASDIKLLESERMTDTPDGGGRRTSNPIPDGVAGNVFPKVSRVDSVYGKVGMRQVYGHVDTVSVETFAGAHAIITDAPDNPRIGVVLFATGSDYDTRTVARDRIESYVIAGPESRMVVYGRQLQNASAVLVYQRPEEPLPEVGDVYALSDETGGVTVAQQFVRVQDVSHELRVFSENNGEFTRRVITLKIGAPLRVEFRGIPSPSANTSSRGNTLLRSTTVADASRYFGIQPVTDEVLEDALEIQVDSIFAPIVPTAQREAAISLASTRGSTALLQSGTSEFTDGPFNGGSGADVSFVVRTSLAMTPGSVRIEFSAGGSFVSVDDGAGNIVIAPGSGSGWTGTVDYENKQVNLSAQFSGTSLVNIFYIPQAPVSQAAQTRAEKVTLANRGTVYAPVFDPLPLPGTLRVEYRALGRWYTLSDLGSGELAGDDPAYGTGIVDYLTGSANVSLGALPDVDSSIIYTWGTAIHYEMRLSDTGGKAYQDIALLHLPISPGELDIEYVADGVTYNVLADSSGVLSGGGVTGTINFDTGLGRLEYGTRLPDFDSLLTVTYKQWALDPAGGIISDPVTTKVLVSVSDLGESVLPATVVGILNMTLTATIDEIDSTTEATFVPFRVDGAGTMTSAQEVAFRNSKVRVTMPLGTVIGALNATTGAILYNPTMTLPTAWYVLGNDHPVWNQGSYLNTANVLGASVTYIPAEYELSGGGTVPSDTADRIYTDHEEELSVEDDAPVRVDLTKTSTAELVAGSVAFTLAGKRFTERNGTLYVDAQMTGSATAAGNINYGTGVASPTLWVRGAALGLAVQSALIKIGDWVSYSAYFRTAGSPLRPGATYVQVSALDGTLLSATSDSSGNIESTYVHGEVEQSMGVVSLRFGEWLTAAGNEGEPWYNPANVVGSLVLKPKLVQPQTLRYSTVVVTNLPLSADILGLDPVRLPSDGRVPIFRPADVIVLHHTANYNAGTPTAGQEIDVGREDLAAIWLEDVNRKKLATALYATDLEAGLVTMDAGLSLTGYVPPIAVRHRIEEMLLVTDVQINGLLSVSAPVSRTYPDGAQVSSALLFGDLFARVENVFDQATWTSVWSNNRIGDQATAQFNDIDYPIEVLNSSAVNDRWRANVLTGGASVQIISENLGVLGTFAMSSDIAPVNPLTGEVYFVIRHQGWGGGWTVGNQLRWNTVAAAPGFWIARTILPGASLAGDSFDLQIRGDAD
jgi:hypothetical protein